LSDLDAAQRIPPAVRLRALLAFAVVLASIVASGAAIGMQVGAAIAIDEVILVGYAATPAKIFLS
jgi:hypothetical protein